MKMKILIALDDSPFSQAALTSVERRLWTEDTEFFLCSVLAPRTESLADESPEQIATLEQARENWCLQTLEFLENKAYSLRQSLLPNKVSFDVLIGDVGERIVTLALDWDADVIVVGSHGRTGRQRALLGSVAEFVVDAAPCDVEVIKSRALLESADFDASSSIAGEQNRVLICVDGSANSIAAINWVAGANWSLGQTFTLLSAIEPVQATNTRTNFTRMAMVRGTHMAMVQRIENSLQECIAVLRTCFPKNTFTAEVVQASAAQAILEFANTWRAGLIVIGAHNENEPFAGSTARQVAGAAKCSVKIFRSDHHTEAAANQIKTDSTQTSFETNSKSSNLQLNDVAQSRFFARDTK